MITSPHSVHKSGARILAVFLALTSFSQAHVSYSGRDLTPAGGSAVVISNQTVSSPFGWADGTDADWGDSHRLRAFRFTLSYDTDVAISISASTNGGAVLGTLLPAFSIYSGLAHLPPAALDHDGAVVTVNYLTALGGREGAFRATDTWKMGSDDGVTDADLSTFTYVGHMADGTAANFGNAAGLVGDGLADGTVSGTFHLPAGTYSLFVGGADYAAGVGAAAPFSNYGITTSLQIVPEPATGLAVACAGFIALRRRRTATFAN